MYEYIKNKNVLYIEDDVDVLNNISTLLENYFAKFYSVTNAEDGWDIFFSKKIDILLVDIELGGISGIDFIKKVRQTHKEVLIIIISAYTKTDYLLESVELKIDRYIVKPFTTKKLYSLLEKMNDAFQENNSLELLSGIHINRYKETVCFNNTLHPLTSKELEFLEILARRRFINYREIDEIWTDYSPSDDAVRSFIKSLRKKLPSGVLKNRQNFGYYV